MHNSCVGYKTVQYIRISTMHCSSIGNTEVGLARTMFKNRIAKGKLAV